MTFSGVWSLKQNASKQGQGIPLIAEHHANSLKNELCPLLCLPRVTIRYYQFNFPMSQLPSCEMSALFGLQGCSEMFCSHGEETALKEFLLLQDLYLLVKCWEQPKVSMVFCLSACDEPLASGHLLQERAWWVPIWRYLFHTSSR